MSNLVEKLSTPAFLFLTMLLLRNPGSRACAEEIATPTDRLKYRLVEIWHVGAQGPVYLREKTVKSTYELDVMDRGTDASGDRRIRVRVANVAVEADIPAQKRSGRFDSSNPPKKLAINHHELIRPIALLGQSLTLTLGPDGLLKRVSDPNAAIKRLDELYDDHLRGSEQDLYTRDIERQQLFGTELQHLWSDIFALIQHKVSAPDFEQNGELVFMACIPSESWMHAVPLSITTTVNDSTQPNGSWSVTQRGELAADELIETTIGDTRWSYTPEKANVTTTCVISADGKIESIHRSQTAVLATTLFLDSGVPIEMTIRTSRKLERR